MAMWVRRLLAFTAAALIFIATPSVSEAAPIPAADLRLCQERPNATETCCPVSCEPAAIKRFNLASVPTTMRVRRPAHLLSTQEWEQLDLAYQRMRALPDDDPRSLEGQRRMHCSHCTPSLPMPAWIDPTNNETAMLDVHASWLFLPWHRLFLYFHERILASLVGNESFALPYWNWDNQDEASLPGAIPAGYADPRSALYDENRNRDHARPAIANLSHVPTFAIELRDLGRRQNNSATLRRHNLAIMQHVLITGSTTKLGFFGRPLRFGDPPLSVRSGGGKGRVEEIVHDAVHLWTSDAYRQDFHDMGSPTTAAGDPIFYAHHSNIDRLWAVWKSMREWRDDIADPDFLDSEFVFYDELAEPVVVQVRQALRPDIDLRYSYQAAPNDGDRRWMTHVPRLCSSNWTSQGPRERQLWVQTIPTMNEAGYTLVYGSPVAFRLTRPQSGPGGGRGVRPGVGPGGGRGDGRSGSAAWMEEVLVVEATFDSRIPPGLLAVFLMLPPDFQDPHPLFDCSEFIGFGNDFSVAAPVPDRALLRLGLGRKLEQIGAEGAREIVVTLAPGIQHHRTLGGPVVVHSVRIHLEPVFI